MSAENIAAPLGKRGLLSSEYTIMGIFFFQAFAGGGMFARIPDMQLKLGLDAGELGLALMGQPLGAILTFVFASVIIEKIGTRILLLCGVPALSVSVVLLALAPSAALLTVGFMLFGISFAISNVAMNVEADRVEAATGNRVMNRCHGLWSIGFLVASLLGVLARGIELSTFYHFLAILPLVAIAALLIFVPMQASPPRAHKGAEPKKKKVFVSPTLTTFLLVGFGLSAVLVEGGTRSWSVIYMRDTFSAPDWIDTLTLPAFLLTMALGRMFSDGWITRFGPVRVAVTLLLVGLAGLSMVIFAQFLAAAIIGFGLMGVGICVIYPLTLSAAAQVGDRPSSQNVASVTMITSLANLAAPGMMGAVANSYGIRASFAVLAPMLIMSLVLSRMLKPKDSESNSD